MWVLVIGFKARAVPCAHTAQCAYTAHVYVSACI